MLYNMSWLQEGKQFPPIEEAARLERYAQNKMLFDSEHFADLPYRKRDYAYGTASTNMIDMYEKCIKRIQQVIGNFDEVISYPVLLNYQKFISTKMADLIVGEHPLVTGKDEAENAKLKWVTDSTNFYDKLYSVIIDLSRYGDCPIRVFKNEDTDFYDWTVWDASQWFPIVAQDGTYRIIKHCLAWLVDESEDSSVHDYYLHVMVFEVAKPSEIVEYVFHNGITGTSIGALVEGYPKTITTGFSTCPVFSLRPYVVSGTVYGYDDYVPIDALLCEIITRVSQISVILDKHADPSMYGPTSALRQNHETGEWYFQRSKYYGVSEDDQAPGYLTWDGQLEAAFNQLEFLINQLYTLSEMGAAITGGIDSSGNAVSGTAMRFKMVNPLAKARRVTNTITNPLRKMISLICSNMPDIDEETAEPGSGEDTKLPFGHISIMWKDGLPDDPRENIEMCKLASGETKMIPLETALMTYLGKSQAEAKQLADQLREEAKQLQQEQLALNQKMQNNDPNKSGPQNGLGVNPRKKGSKNGMNSFQASTNQKPEDK